MQWRKTRRLLNIPVNSVSACNISEYRVPTQGSQLALIDGDPSLAKALRDFENLEALAAPNSIIAIHDVVPMTWMPQRQRRRPRQRSIPIGGQRVVGRG